jgi:tetratricopeptide (TPR) repeat protein
MPIRTTLPPRTTSYRALGFTVIALAALAGGLWGLHRYQSQRSAVVLETRAQESWAAGKPLDAIRQQRMFLRLRPDDVEGETRLKLWLSTRSDTASIREAREGLEKLLRRDANRKDLREALLLLANRTGRREDAARHAASFVGDKDLSLGIMLECATALARGGNEGDARAMFERARGAAPTDLNVLEQFIRFLMAGRRDPTGAESLLEQFTRLSPEDPNAWRRAAQLRQELKLGQAEPLIDEALQKWPDDVPLLLTGVSMGISTRPTWAAGLINRLEELAPQSPEVLLIGGRWAYQNGRFKEAIERYRKGASTETPLGREMLWRLIEVALETGDANEVEIRMPTLAALPGYRAVVLYLQGRREALRGRVDEALRLLEASQRLVRSMAIPGSDRSEIPYRVELALGSIRAGVGELEAAQRHALRAEELKPAEIAPLVLLGGVRQRLGDHAGAAEAWSEARTRPMAPSGVSFELARALLNLEREKTVSARNFDRFDEEFKVAARSLPDLPAVGLLEADAWLLRGDPERALKPLRAQWQADPSRGPVGLSFVNVLTQLGRFDQARAIADGMVTRFAGSPSLATARARLDLYAGKPPDQAELPPPPPGQPDPLAPIRAALSFWTQAETEGIRQLETLAATDETAAATLVDIDLHRGRYAGAFARISRLRDLESDQPLWRLLDAWCVAEFTGGALDLWEPLFKEHARQSGAQRARWWGNAELNGLLEESRGRDQAALTLYRRGLASGPALSSVVRRALRIGGDSRTERDDIIRLVRATRFPLPADARFDPALTPALTAANLPAIIDPGAEDGTRTLDAIRTQARKLALAQPADEALWLAAGGLHEGADSLSIESLILEVESKSTSGAPLWLAVRVALAAKARTEAVKRATALMNAEFPDELTARLALALLRMADSSALPAALTRAENQFPKAWWRTAP